MAGVGPAVGCSLNLIGINVQAVLLNGPVRADRAVGARGVVIAGIDVAGDRHAARNIRHSLRAIGSQGTGNDALEVALGRSEEHPSHLQPPFNLPSPLLLSTQNNTTRPPP